MREGCKHWIELDGSMGLFEFCRGTRKRCTCSGVEGQCNYRGYFEEEIKGGETWRHTAISALRVLGRLSKKTTSAVVRTFSMRSIVSYMRKS